MSYFGVSDQLEFQNSRVEDCLKLMENLGLVKKEGKIVNILDQKVVEAAKEGINPIEAKIVLDILNDKSLRWEQQQRISNLLCIALVVLHNEGTLRQGKQELESVAHIKPNGIWRKSGYLESCL